MASTFATDFTAVAFPDLLSQFGEDVTVAGATTSGLVSEYTLDKKGDPLGLVSDYDMRITIATEPAIGAVISARGFDFAVVRVAAKAGGVYEAHCRKQKIAERSKEKYRIGG